MCHDDDELTEIAKIGTEIVLKMDSKVFDLIDVSLSQRVVDYAMCILCQSSKKTHLNQIEHLSDPFKLKGKNISESYDNLVAMLKVFQKLTNLPRHLTFLVKEPNLARHLEEEKAVWHKSCKLLYTESKAKKLHCQQEKRAKVEDIPSTSSSSHINESNEPVAADGHNIQRRSNRNSQANDDGVFTCLLCDEVEFGINLHSVSTLNANENIRRSATILNDQKLLMKVSAGDLIATEAKYHVNCLAKLYNDARSAKKEKESESHESQRKSSWLQSVAFAELCDYIRSFLKQNEKVILPLADIHKVLTERMMELGQSCYLHKTRLKDKLIAEFPDLEMTTCGNKIVFYRKAFTYCADAEDHEAEAKLFVLVSNIVRKDNWKNKISIDDVDQENSVSTKMITLVNLILKGCGSDISNEDDPQPALTIAQLMKFNMTKGKYTRHRVEQETPIVRYVANVLHHEKRAKTLIGKFHSLGLCISYKRSLEMSTMLGNRACDAFESEGVVVPRNLPKNQFVTMAVDNIDHNMTSSTSKGSFHGTAITVHTHPDSVADIVAPIPNECSNFGTQSRFKLKSLPLAYSVVEPIVEVEKKTITTPLYSCLPEMTRDTIEAALTTECEWVDLVETTLNAESLKDVNVNWSSFHANRQEKDIIPCQIGLLPLFQESAHTSSMIYHSMNICKKVTNYLNEGQTAVCACDEPLYAIFKELQWTYPELFDNIFPVMGSLHFEMVLLRCVGQLLEGSEWEIALAEAGIATAGTAESFFTVNHVMKCRHAHEVTVAVIQILQRRAFMKREASESSTSFSDWVEKQADKFPTFQYWNTVLKLEQLLLLFIRSVREANYELYLCVLVECEPWLFALDHTKYSKWGAVFIEDLKNLKEKFPDVHKEFLKGRFVIHKTAKNFSGIGIDQAHEQQNAIIKGQGGAIGLFDNPASLLRWMVAGPEISRLINAFEDCAALSNDKKNSTKHHSQGEADQKRFITDVNSLLDIIEQYGNPFEEDSTHLMTLISNCQFNEDTKATLKKLAEIGEKQYSDFVEKRLQSKQINFFDPVKTNSFNIFKEKAPRKVSSLEIKNKMLRNDYKLFAQLFLGAQSRKVDLDQFFNNENQPFPPSISENGHLRKGPKGNIVDCLCDTYKDENLEHLEYGTQDDATAFFVDGAVIVHFINPAGARTFSEYSFKIQEYFRQHTKKFKRIDVLWDVYRSDSIKRDAREKRGVGRAQKVDANLKIPKNWSNFLNVDDNKTNLFKLLAQDIVKVDSTNCLIVTNVGENVITSTTHDCSLIEPCNHEESDTRIFVHVRDAVHAGHTKVIIRSVDSDIVVLAVAFFGVTEEIQELYVAYGTKTKYRYIPIHLIVRRLGKRRSLALPMFHAITGCDTVSWFYGRGKKIAWEVWDFMGDELTEAFLCISGESWDNIECSSHFRVIQKFVTMLYDRKYTESTHATLDILRQYLFVNQSRTSIENLPPTNGSFLQHLKRAVYQGSMCWGFFDKKMTLPDPTLWGWTLSQGQYFPHWTDLPDISKACRGFTKCNCKKGCSNRCGCEKAEIACAIFCGCKGDCQRQKRTKEQKIVEEI